MGDAIIFDGGCNPPNHPPNNFLYAAIFDDLSCGFNALSFLANMVTNCYSLLLFTHSINKGQTSIVRIAEKTIKLRFLYAAEQRCSKKKKETSVAHSKKKSALVSCPLAKCAAFKCSNNSVEKQTIMNEQWCHAL